MASSILSNGLLGLGGFGLGGNSMPANSLLGEFYNPADMRKYQMKQMLLGLGAGLMAEKGMGKGAALALAAGDRAGTQYRENAFDAYKLKTAQDEQAYQRQQDAEQAKRQAKQDAMQSTLFQHQLEGWQQQEDQKAAADQAFQNIRRMPSTGVPVQNYALSDQLYKMGRTDDALGIVLPQATEQKAPSVDTFYDEKTGQPYKAQWDGHQWVPVGGKKSPENGITVTNPDGTTMTVGGSGQKMTSDVRRGKLLADQVVGQQDQIMAGFDALASPKNYAGTKVPGGAAVMSAEAQVAQDALTNTVANWLYLTSGATATDAEIERQTAMVTPTPMDSPQRIAAKKARLKSMILAMQGYAGETPATAQPSGADDGWTELPNGVKIRQKAN